MGKAIGVGGIFLHFQGEEQAVLEWYEQHLQLKMSSYGTNFISGDQLILLSFKRSNKPTTPFINFRVDNIREIIIHLQNEGCSITSEIQEYPYGLFAQFKDPFGNYIELWEPNIEEYKRMVTQENIEYLQKKSTNNK